MLGVVDLRVELHSVETPRHVGDGHIGAGTPPKGRRWTISAAVSSGDAGSVVGEDDPCTRACGEEVRRGERVAANAASVTFVGSGRPVYAAKGAPRRSASSRTGELFRSSRRKVSAPTRIASPTPTGASPRAPVGGRRENESPGRPIEIHIAVALTGRLQAHTFIVVIRTRVISGFALRSAWKSYISYAVA